MGHRKLNWKPLLALAIVLAVLAGVTHFVHGIQTERHARTLRQQAEEAEQAGQLDRALLLLQRYLQFCPGDLDTLERCAALLDRSAVSAEQRQRIVTLYDQVLAREPYRFDTRRKLAAELVHQGACVLARRHLDYLLEHQPGHAEDEALMGFCLEMAGETEAALGSYERALARDPLRRDVGVRLAGLWEGPLRQPQKATAVMDRLVAADRDGHGWLERGRYRMAHGALGPAADDLAQARKIAPDDPDVLLASADLASRRGQFDDARTWLRRVLEQTPNHAGAYLALAGVEVQAGRTTEATACLRRGLDRLPDQADLLSLLAEIAIDAGDEAAAQETIARLRRTGLPGGLADYLEGRRLLHRHEWARGLAILGEVVELGGLSPALAARAALAAAEAHEHLGDGERRLAVLEKAVEWAPSSGAAHLALATALDAAGRSEEALGHWRQAAAGPRPPDEAWALLARALVRRNAALPADRRQWQEIDQLLDLAAQLPKQAAAVALARAEAQVFRGRLDEAQALLREALKRDAAQLGLWAALADVAAHQGDAAGGRRVLADARRHLGDSFELRLAVVELCTRADRETLAELRALEQGLDSFTAEQRDRLLIALVARFFEIGEVAEGARLCRRLAAAPAADWSQRLALLDLVLQSGDDTLTAAVIADLRRLEGEEGTWWRYGEAARRLAKARSGDPQALREAAAFVDEAARRRPNWSRVALLRAQLADLGGNTLQATDGYLAAFDLGERQPGMVRRLVRLLLHAGRDEAADGVLRRVQQQSPLTGATARLAAEVALRLRNPERAAEMALHAIPAGDKDYRDQVWLGQVLALAGRRADAETALRRAVALTDTLPEPWIALVAHLARSDQAAADAALADMQRRLPADQRPLALAVCCEALARFPEARQHYLAALQTQPNDGLVLQRGASFFVRLDSPHDSIPLLRRLLDPAIQVPSSSHVWARRQLALALAFAGDDAGYQEAEKLLRDDIGDAAGQRTRDLVAATRSDGRAEALSRIEASRKLQPMTADELFRLAGLYEKVGDDEHARETMLDLLTLDMQNPEYLAHHIAALLRRRKVDEARPWLERLERLEGNSERAQAFRSALTAAARK
jgi:Tfp pilus assembly protein PilF